jgi:hypothetical protein
MPVHKATISFREEIFKMIEKRAEGEEYSRSEVINRDLERYYKLVTASRISAVAKLTDMQFTAVIASFKGTNFTGISSTALISQVGDAYDLGELSGIDGFDNYEWEELMDILQRFSHSEVVAVIDTAERYWTEVGKGRTNLEPAEFREELYKENSKITYKAQ